MIKNTGEDNSNGGMEGNMKVFGLTVNKLYILGK